MPGHVLHHCRANNGWLMWCILQLSDQLWHCRSACQTPHRSKAAMLHDQTRESPPLCEGLHDAVAGCMRNSPVMMQSEEADTEQDPCSQPMSRLTGCSHLEDLISRHSAMPHCHAHGPKSAAPHSRGRQDPCCPILAGWLAESRARLGPNGGWRSVRCQGCGCRQA